MVEKHHEAQNSAGQEEKSASKVFHGLNKILNHFLQWQKQVLIKTSHPLG